MGDISRLGLDPERVREHATTLSQALAANLRPTFEIIDTCRRDNGGILLTPEVEARSEDPTAIASGFVAFVPAAGAASRYSQPFQGLIQALEKGDIAGIDQALDVLRSLGAASWPLPQLVATLVQDKSALKDLTSTDLLAVLRLLLLPKALMPGVTDGDSFLALKLLEHRGLPGLAGQVFITPPEMEHEFQQTIDDVKSQITADATNSQIELRTLFIPQGPALSTIRFHRDGSPFLNGDGRPSTVPAGHGALIEILPLVRDHFPDAHSVFIRNIDNVVGTKDEATAATYSFLHFHRSILNAVKGVRAALAKSDLKSAADAAKLLRCHIPASQGSLGAEAAAKIAAIDNAYMRSLWDIQARLFHGHVPDEISIKTLKLAYDRPVNTLGQVPNTGKDIGGTPCFVRVDNKQVKICIEVPHVSEQDKITFLSNPAKATHFNPVFAAAELIGEDDLPRLRQHDFWILSEKNYKGQPVVYFETVLYELLGNSHLANCVFVEVPRSVFNPHKSIQDAAGRARSHWF
jgi:hypothetical protein